MSTEFKIPFYARAALIFIGLFSFVFLLYVGQSIIIPIVFGTILAILLNPLVNFLQSKGLHKVIAISIGVLLVILIIGGIFYIVSSQVTMFSETWPELKAKFTSSSNEFVQWISTKFNIRVSKINAWTKETQSNAIDDLELGQRLTEVGSLLLTLMLLPAYLFMILYYKPLLLNFIRRLFQREHQTTVDEVLNKTKKIIQTYLVGLFFEMVIVAALNSIGLLLLGIDYAIILGITGAILNLIPYIGGVVAIILPAIMAFVTKESVYYPFLVVVLYAFVQLVDNNYVIPKVVASRVKINALISVIVLLIGGALWGVAGMFLSIPLTAILKVVFDHIEPMKPWGFLLGNMVPTTRKPLLRQKTQKTE